MIETVNFLPMGIYTLELRGDGLFNASSFINQWNKENKENKRLSDFIGSNTEVLYNKDNQENIWLNEYDFGNLLIFLNTELFFVDFQLCKLENCYSEKLKGCYKRKNKKYFTYILKDKNGYYKIGKSANIEKRIKQLSIGNICLEKILSVPFDCEKELHLQFKHKHITGEWFELDDDDVELIKKYTEKHNPKVFLT